MSPDTRDLAIEALLDKLDALRSDVRQRPDYFDKADIYGRLHRNRMASLLVSVRTAVADLRLEQKLARMASPWPTWMAEPDNAAEAWSWEGR